MPFKSTDENITGGKDFPDLYYEEDNLVSLTIDRQKVRVEKGMTILEAARWMGIKIPTLCYHEGLTPWGGCRLCVVEVIKRGRSKLEASCTYPVAEGIQVKTNSEKVQKTRRMIVELLISSCPNSRTLQDLASGMGITEIRFKMEDNDCILCGLCVRMCKEQMMSGGIGFINRGAKREVSTPFHKSSEICRGCGACMYICPVVTLQCRGRREPGDLCNACINVCPTDFGF
ncbi:MAG: (2Fe-2S)-binding protein [Candidatus Eremiobacteraeota bacterium]|nr:(2Fe-2S)-binding protein [Candidatus Eremiobacteraeota bacterium]